MGQQGYGDRGQHQRALCIANGSGHLKWTFTNTSMALVDRGSISSLGVCHMDCRRNWCSMRYYRRMQLESGTREPHGLELHSMIPLKRYALLHLCI